MRKVWIGKNGRKLWSGLLTESFFDRASGLMFKRNVVPLVFDFGREGTRANAIHSFFCPVFDAVFLDSQKRVSCVFRKVRPGIALLAPSRESRFLIELPAGESTKVRVGDKIGWREASAKARRRLGS